tara:strand:+ start:307 stop:1440 length:1134 start_codon:yes stop_codon:yes gene_type:complete
VSLKISSRYLNQNKESKMTDENQIEDQDVELQEDDEEILEMQKHDPKNAEAQSVASVDKAGDATGTAGSRKMAGGTAADSTKKDPMPKLTKAGMINAMYHKANKAKKAEVEAMYNSVMRDHVENEDEAIIEDKPSIDYKADFKDDLKALVSEEATLSDDFKAKAETIFEAAIQSKLSDEIDRLEEKFNEELTAEVDQTKADLVEKVDSYLNYVVENWMSENKLAIQNGLRTEIAEDFMNKLKDLFTESYIEVPEGKTDLVDELAGTVDELEQKLNDTTGQAIEMAEELEGYKREAVIREASKDLAETQVEKLKGLVENIDFEDQETFAKKVATVKESYFTKTTNTASGEAEVEDGPVVETSGSMASYLSAIKKTANK